MIMKQYFYKIIPKFNDIKLIDKEVYDFGEHIPDVYIELNNGKKISIECQDSPLSIKELKNRTKFYSNQNIYTLWVLSSSFIDNNSYCNFILGNNKKEIVLKSNQIERFIYFSLYFRIYYLDFFKREDKITTQFKVIYLLKKDERKIPSRLYYTPWGEPKYFGGYNKKYKNRFIIKIKPIETFKLLCIENNGYKLARFYDKHPNNNN